MSNIDPGWGSWAEAPPPIPIESISRELTADVVIIGAGIAGMTCALRAAQVGAEVLVLEQSGSWTARGMNIGIIDSSYQKERGWDYNAGDVAREWIKICGNRCDEKLVWAYLKNGGRAMDWLLEMLSRPEYYTRTAIYSCVYKGDKYRELMTSHWLLDSPMAKKGDPQSVAAANYAMHSEGLKLGVRYIYKTRGEQLVKEDGCVKGVIAKDSSGYLIAKARRGIVLATGDISGNDEMCKDLAPIANRCASKISWPKNANLGDGHRMGLWAGGAFEDTPFPSMIHPQAYGHLQYCFLYVRQDGTRFMNEDNFVQGKSLALLRDNEKYAWAIVDSDWPSKVPPTLRYGGGMFWGQDWFRDMENPEYSQEQEQRRFDKDTEDGFIVKADTPEELAKKMGVPAESFVAEMKRYNELCAKGIDEDFGKRQELMIPLDKPPYFGVKFGPALLAVVGGLRVDTKMRVLDETRTPVEGLYAIGNTVGGRYGVDYPIHVPGNSCGSALTFGYLLGESFRGEP